MNERVVPTPKSVLPGGFATVDDALCDWAFRLDHRTMKASYGGLVLMVEGAFDYQSDKVKCYDVCSYLGGHGGEKGSAALTLDLLRQAVTFMERVVEREAAS